MNISGAIVVDVYPAPEPDPPRGQISELTPGYEFNNGEVTMIADENTPDQVEGSIHESQENETEQQHSLTNEQFEASVTADQILEDEKDLEEDEEAEIEEE